jgi:hypothetical protein
MLDASTTLPTQGGTLLQSQLKLKLERKMIKIDFEFDTPHGVFRDALHLVEDRVYSPSEIEGLKNERLNNWLAIVNPPPFEQPAQE